MQIYGGMFDISYAISIQFLNCPLHNPSKWLAEGCLILYHDIKLWVISCRQWRPWLLLWILQSLSYDVLLEITNYTNYVLWCTVYIHLDLIRNDSLGSLSTNVYFWKILGTWLHLENTVPFAGVLAVVCVYTEANISTSTSWQCWEDIVIMYVSVATSSAYK